MFSLSWEWEELCIKLCPGYPQARDVTTAKAVKAKKIHNRAQSVIDRLPGSSDHNVIEAVWDLILTENGTKGSQYLKKSISIRAIPENYLKK